MLKTMKYALVASFALFATACDEDEGTGPGVSTEFSADLQGANERPEPVTTDAEGSATVVLNDDAETITFTVTVSDLVNVTLAHIHTGGSNETGPPVVTLLGTAMPGPVNGVLISGTVGVSAITGESYASLAQKIRSGNAYINVHTVTYPAGEIRGQLEAEN